MNIPYRLLPHLEVITSYLFTHFLFHAFCYLHLVRSLEQQPTCLANVAFWWNLTKLHTQAATPSLLFWDCFAATFQVLTSFLQKVTYSIFFRHFLIQINKIYGCTSWSAGNGLPELFSDITHRDSILWLVCISAPTYLFVFLFCYFFLDVTPVHKNYHWRWHSCPLDKTLTSLWKILRASNVLILYHWYLFLILLICLYLNTCLYGTSFFWRDHKLKAHAFYALC